MDSITQQRRAVNAAWYAEFIKHHREWMRGIVAQYKQRGQFPVIPTQIIDYYPDAADKEVAIFSTLCMDWDNGHELEQIAAMRDLMWPHPANWFRHREYAYISIARLQMNRLDGSSNAHYWKIARTFDILHKLCETDFELISLRAAFRKMSMEKYCKQVAQECGFTFLPYKQRVIELVLHTNEGIGRGIWKARPEKVRCPRNKAIYDFVQDWFPFLKKDRYDFDEAVKFLGFDYDYDVFYAYLAWSELQKLYPTECQRYQRRFNFIFDNRQILHRKIWFGKNGCIPQVSLI
jgi:hypothetical protein